MIVVVTVVVTVIGIEVVKLVEQAIDERWNNYWGGTAKKAMSQAVPWPSNGGD